MQENKPLARDDELKMFCPQVAKELGLGERHLYRLLSNRTLPEPQNVIVHPRTNQRIRLWTRAEIESARVILAERQDRRKDPVARVKQMFGGRVPSLPELQAKVAELKRQTAALTKAEKYMSGAAKVEPKQESESHVEQTEIIRSAEAIVSKIS